MAKDSDESKKLPYGELEKCVLGSKPEKDPIYREMMMEVEAGLESEFQACISTSLGNHWESNLRKYIESLYEQARESWVEAGRYVNDEFYECLYTCVLEKRIDEMVEHRLKYLEGEDRSLVFWTSGIGQHSGFSGE